MTKSESIAKLATALAKFQGAMTAVKKEADNPYYKSKYADLAGIVEAIKKPLADNGLSYAQFPSGEHGLATILMHESGEWIEETFFMKPVEKEVKSSASASVRLVITPQDSGSIITYMRRYALGAVLGIATEVDDDGNRASGKGHHLDKDAKEPDFL